MKKIKFSNKCNFCEKNFKFVLTLNNKKILLCETCAKQLYQGLAKVLVPKGLPNMVMRATNNSTIKRFEDLQNLEDKSFESKYKNENKQNLKKNKK